MISIQEKKSVSVPGLTSLFLFLSYNKEAIDIISSSGAAKYNHKDNTWECPLTSLSFLLDNLTYLDDITLTLLEDRKDENPIKPVLTNLYRTHPFDYQTEGITYGLNHDKWLLLDEPGLGKTLQLIYLAEELKYQRNIEHCLIICGINALKTNWEKEIIKHSREDCVIIGRKISKKGRVSYTSVKERIEQIKKPINEFFIIVNIESLRNDAFTEAIMTSPNKIGAIWFDECHKAKGWKSHQGLNLVKLDAPYMVGATGTLIMNNPLDAYIPLVFIGKEPKRSVTNYKKTYCVFDSKTLGKIVGFQNLDLLKDELDACSLRRTRDMLVKAGKADYPPISYISRFVDMEDKHAKFYEDIANGVKEEANKIVLKPNNLLAMTTRLRQATSCPSVLTTEDIPSSKVDYAIDLAEEIISNNDKVVIFSSFKEPIYRLKELLKDYNPLVGTGDMKDEDVSHNIDLFQADPKYKVFLGTIQKMGTGITLTAASSVIFIDEPFTEALYEQAADRVYRCGQTKSVCIYTLICSDTIDSAVDAIIKRKRAISDFTIDDKMDDDEEYILKQYINDL